MKNIFKNISFLLIPALFLLASCQQTPPSGLKVGKPYSVEGKTYYPEYDPTYDKIGQASWYGPGFHGKYTASGERFDQEDITAAHPTLPMPSMVRVTNLKNGRSLIVRVNDRGPFKSNRIIDLSKRAAEKLGIKSIETVRVQFLKHETMQYLASIGVPPEKMQALNDKASSERDQSIIRSTEPSDKPDGQIIESSVANTHAGQVVDTAAPVMTVNSEDLDQQSDAPKLPVSELNPGAGTTTPVPPSGGLIKQAMADDRVESLAPPQEPVKVESADTKPVEKTSNQKMSQFYIQAGSFSAEENARKLSGKLSGLGAIDVGKIEMGGKTWWRVRVGPFNGHEEAMAALENVRAANLPDARIIHQ